MPIPQRDRVRIFVWQLALVCGAWLPAICPVSADQARRDDETVSFNFQVRPILSENCFQCHGPDEAQRQADLRLDIPPGDDADIRPGALEAPVATELVSRITAGSDEHRMPPADSAKMLTAEQIELLKRWVKQGARYERHWSFRPLDRSQPPAVNDEAWIDNTIDRFILNKLEQKSLQPSPRAPREVLMRRVYLDLVGLLPTPEEVDEFVADRSEHAYAQLVERLLDSKHYGERWGRHWLDQARYADSNGYTIDKKRVMWPYRDWVIDALNNDLPFDRFTIEQIAGDLLPQPTTAQLIATGFHRNTLINDEGGTDDEQFRVESVVDRVNTTGAVWLGLTVGCAQCHTHKFDPISQREYYQMLAFFNSTADKNNVGPTIVAKPPPRQDKIDEIERLLSQLKQKSVADNSATQARAAKVKQLEAEKKKLAAQAVRSMVMRELDQPRKSHILIRGDFLRPGEPVDPGVPVAIKTAMQADRFRSRLDLAKWLVDPTNPLTPRVTMNRLWQQYFGRGLVETENDFGTQGTPPSHPELLDWLAAELIRQDWSLKAMHRLIVNSSTYQQSSVARADLTVIDPLNKLLARQSRIRVEAEIVRDLALCASGKLSREIGGPSVFPPQPEGVYAFTQQKKKWPTSKGPERYRRTMYTFFFRSAPHPMLTTFDMPRFNAACTRRTRSNTPLQSLMVANDAGLYELAQALAARVLSREMSGDHVRIQRMFRLCLCRSPLSEEVERLRAYLQQERARVATDITATKSDSPPGSHPTDPEEQAAWTAVARVLLNLDEFITRE